MRKLVQLTMVASLAVTLLTGCGSLPRAGAPRGGTFTDDVAFLKQHTDVIVLGDEDSRVAVVPAYQGRVMTSTTGGEADLSFGWLNYDVIASGLQPPEAIEGMLQEHIHVFGGEERFWMGPEGGQYAIYFKQGDPFDFDHWHTPAIIDTVSYDLVTNTAHKAVFRKDFRLTNYSGTRFNGSILRTVRAYSRARVESVFGASTLADVDAVVYETRNIIKNRGPNDWTRDGGLLSIWLLGMYNPGANTTVVIPFEEGADADLGPKVNDTYFGKVPAERLVVRDNVLFFSADGTYRSKIGLGPRRARGVAGSYDADNRVLTLVSYNRASSDQPYVNSMWELQDDPYGGDVINSYNDGPPKPGADPLGPFYELETSSPAAELEAGATLKHIQRTAHFQGAEDALDAIAQKWLGVSLEDIKTAL